MDLDREVAKIRKFAQTLYVKPKEYARHNTILFFLITFLFGLHLLLSFAVIYVPWWAALLMGLFHAYILYYYLVTIVHEGSHDLVFFAREEKNTLRIRALMPALALVAGFPAFRVYLRDHILHHRYLSEERDPQNSEYLNFRKIPTYYLTRKRPAFDWKHFSSETNWVAYVIAGLLFLGHLWLVWLWGGALGILFGLAIPMVGAVLLNAIRISFRHYRLYPNPMPLRSRAYTFLGSRVIGPGGLRYHFSHHLFPKIPSYKLGRMYRWIRKNCSQELVEKVQYTKFHWKDFW